MHFFFARTSTDKIERFAFLISDVRRHSEKHLLKKKPTPTISDVCWCTSIPMMMVFASAAAAATTANWLNNPILKKYWSAPIYIKLCVMGARRRICRGYTIPSIDRLPPGRALAANFSKPKKKEDWCAMRRKWIGLRAQERLCLGWWSKSWSCRAVLKWWPLTGLVWFWMCSLPNRKRLIRLDMVRDGPIHRYRQGRASHNPNHTLEPRTAKTILTKMWLDLCVESAKSAVGPQYNPPHELASQYSFGSDRRPSAMLMSSELAAPVLT